jgi:hypothetical protein
MVGGPLRVVSDSALFFDVDGAVVYVLEDWFSKRIEFEPGWEIVRVAQDGSREVAASGQYASEHYAIGALAAADGVVAWRMNHRQEHKSQDRADSQIFVQRPDGGLFVIQERDRGAMSKLWVSGRFVGFSGNSEYETDLDLPIPEAEPRDSHEYVADLDRGVIWRLANCPGCGAMGVAGDLVVWQEDPVPSWEGNGYYPIGSRIGRLA